MDIPSFSTSQNLYNIRTCLAGGGNPNDCNQFQDTLLHVSAKDPGCFEFIPELVRAGALVNAVNVFGLTPLHIAVIYRNHKVVDALLSLGALMNTEDCFGNSVLHSAISTCVPTDKDWICNFPQCVHLEPDMNIVEKVLNHGCIDVNKRNAKGFTPLLLAVKDENADIVKALLRKSAKVNIGNHCFETPLHVALSQRRPNMDIVAELLRRGASLNTYDISCRTPLDLIFKRLGDTESGAFAEELVKLITFFDRENKMINNGLRTNFVMLRLLHQKCLQEIEKMRKYIIGKTSLYDFVLQRMIDVPPVPLEIKIVNNLYKILKPGRLKIYLNIILKYISCPALDNMLSDHKKDLSHKDT